MKQLWRRWSERIDAMGLRERALVFFAAALVLLIAFNWLAIGPTQERQRQVARQLAQKQADMRLLHEQTQKLLGTRTQDPNAAKRERLAALKQRLAAIDADLAERQRGLVPPERIPGLLEEMLRRDRRLELVALRSLPAVALGADKEATGDAAAAARAGLRIYRHGVEVTVRGGYFELLRYVTELERLPLRMFWHEIDLAATDYPTITMKLTVYTLSLERAWLVV